MARSYGRLFTSIWDDEDFRPLSVGAKLMYSFLVSQSDLEHSGIIGWRPSRWALDLGEPIEDLIAWLKELDQARYLIIDEARGEVLVRSLIRRDDIWKQPNVFKSAAASAKASKSQRIKAALYHEVRRLTLIGTGRETRIIRDELLSHLEPFANRSPNPPEGFPNGSADPNGSPAEPSAKGSGGVSEGLANHSAGPTGKGEGYGPVLEDAFPHSPTPSPVAATEPRRPPRLAVVPDVQAEEGDSFEDEPPDIGSLIAEVRALRPDWSTRSIRRALDDPAVRERPWPLARKAMHVVAADPASKAPGRLSHDGPWWHQGAAERAAEPPTPWCGQCAPNRRLEDADGNDAGPCPRCNPKARVS